MNLDRSRLTEIAGLSDPLGVLSIYVTADPDENAERPAWQVRTRNSLDALLDRARDSDDRELDQALRGRIDTLTADLDWALSPSTSGLGRALFVPLSNGAVHQVSVQEPLGDLVRCNDRAYLRPLLSAWAAGSPTGIAVATGEGIRIIHYQLGLAEDIAHLQYVDQSSQWTELKGPANSQPGFARRTAPQHDLFEARREQDLKRYLSSGHETLRRHAAEDGWEFLVIAGDPRLREAMVEHLGLEFAPTIVPVDHVMGMTHPAPAEIAELVKPVLQQARTDRDRALIHRLDETKKSARGIDQTLAAVQEGRAEIILMADDTEWSGQRDRQGQYVAGDVVPPGSDGNGLIPEPELGERVIELALDNRTDVAVLPGDIAEEMAGANGLAAILRW